jgi:hypothetical protein
MKLVLAPHVEFDEARHEYWCQGQQLSGVTGLISEKLGLKMPQEFVEEHQMEGIHVHKAIQKWIETSDPDSVHPGVRWVIDTIKDEMGIGPYFSEVLVSDFSKYASSVDIIVATLPPLRRHIAICDIKKGIFHRDYLSWQLGIYKYMIERNTDYLVERCVCICLKDQEYYDIFPKPAEQVEKLLYG